jgi:hypothetical protein
MKPPTPHQQANQQAVMHDELVGQIHDRLVDDNNFDVVHAFNQACVEIAELYRGLEALEKASSSGFVRVRRSNSRD